MRLRRRRSRPALIDPGLASSLAGQVAVGLARQVALEGAGVRINDLELYIRELEQANARARGALVAIGLMVRNAARDELVDELLAQEVTVTTDGYTTRLSIDPTAPDA